MEKKKVIVRTNDGVFLNSKAFFVEYMDIIKSPYFTQLGFFFICSSANLSMS